MIINKEQTKANLFDLWFTIQTNSNNKQFVYITKTEAALLNSMGNDVEDGIYYITPKNK